MRLPVTLRGTGSPCCLCSGCVLVACGSGSSCATSPVPASCPDLLIGGKPYVVWRQIPPPDALQEVADGTYPACNLSTGRRGPAPGRGATDVWKYDGVAPARAVIGFLENSRTYAVYVRRGVDTSTLPRALTFAFPLWPGPRRLCEHRASRARAHARDVWASTGAGSAAYRPRPGVPPARPR